MKLGKSQQRSGVNHLLMRLRFMRSDRVGRKVTAVTKEGTSVNLLKLKRTAPYRQNLGKFILFTFGRCGILGNLQVEKN